MKPIKEILIASRHLIQNTGWCQDQYAVKDGKTQYNFTNEAADSYCLTGAITKIAYDFLRQSLCIDNTTRAYYNKLAWDAAHLVVELQDFNGSPAEWNDQNKEADMTQEYITELRAKNIPRDKAKPMMAKFKQELKAKNIPPTMTKEKVLAAIDYAIAAID